jgi:putative hemolysin
MKKMHRTIGSALIGLSLIACGTPEVETSDPNEAVTVKKTGGGGPGNEYCVCRPGRKKDEWGRTILNCQTPFGPTCTTGFCGAKPSFMWNPTGPVGSPVEEDDGFGCVMVTFSFPPPSP